MIEKTFQAKASKPEGQPEECDDDKEVELFGFIFEYEDGADTIFRCKGEYIVAIARFASPELAEAAFKKLEALSKIQWAVIPYQEVPINA